MSTGGARIDGERAWRWLLELGELTEPGRPWTRCAFTPQHAIGRAWLAEHFRAAGLAVRVDAAGNLIGRREGTDASARTLMIGSHSDTVNGGGRFDGIAGVIAGLEIAAALEATGTQLRHALEIVDFLAEEPNPYGLSCVGSRGISGDLDAAMLERRDAAGVSLRERLVEAGSGGVPVEQARRTDIAAFLELHIEQGPVLEQRGIDLGIVTHIAGIRRLAMRLRGQAAHAGTTPYALRQDALVGAARFVAGLPALIGSAPPGGPYLIATVGELAVRPNAPNVVPGEVRLTVDLRSDDSAALDAWTARVEAFARDCAQDSAVALEDFAVLSTSQPAPCAPVLSAALAASARSLGFSTQPMVSGAGHDAAFLARVAPSAMLFVPSRRGMSHTADEWTEQAQLVAGIDVLFGALRALDAEPIA